MLESLAFTALLAAPAHAAPKRPSNVLLIVIDALRADRLGAYGYARPTSPHLDALAAEGALFEDVWAQSNWTLPSMASLLTGQYPGVAGAVRPQDALPASRTTLAERFLEKGYRTAAFSANGFVGRGAGLLQGVEHAPRLLGARAPKLTQEAVNWIRGPGGKPFFALIHILDVHGLPGTPSYATTPEYDAKFMPKEADLEHDAEGLLARTARYDGALAFVDAQLGALFERLEALAVWDDTLVVIASDHGEEFAEHGEFGHGANGHETSLRVPLIVAGPGIAARRVRAPVQNLDLAATLCARAFGLRPQELQGRDLSPLLEGKPLPETARFAEFKGAAAVRLETWKYLRGADGVEQLYDLARDPGETRDLARKNPERAATLRVQWKRFAEANAALLKAYAAGGEQARHGREAREMLKRMGYTE